MSEKSVKEEKEVEDIVVAIEAINIKTEGDGTSNNEMGSSVISSTDAQSVVSDSVTSATQPKFNIKQKKRFHKKKFKKNRSISESSEVFITSVTPTSLKVESTSDHIAKDKRPYKSVKENTIKTGEAKNVKHKIGRKQFNNLQLPYNGRIIDGVIYATDENNVLSPIKTPRSFHKNANQFPVVNGLIPLTYETPFRVRNNHSYGNNYRINYPLSIAYMPQQKFFKNSSNHQSNNLVEDYYYGQNPFPKIVKKPDSTNYNKVTEKVESEHLKSTEIVDENLNVSSTSVNTLIALD